MDNTCARVLLNETGDKLREAERNTYPLNTIADAPGDIQPGACVTAWCSNGQFAGHGYFNPLSKLPLRILSFDTPVDLDYWKNAITDALRFRLRHYSKENSFRLVFGDADYIPGLIVDKFSTTLVVQVTTAGIERSIPDILDALEEVIQPETIYMACDSLPRKKEGLELYRKTARGKDQKIIEAQVDDARHVIDLVNGHKTGFFLDQRNNRKQAATLCSDKNVLDMFCFTGAFGLNAALNNAARVTSVDIHQPSIDLGVSSSKLNKISDKIEFVRQEGSDFLSNSSDKFDVIFLDPPSFVRGSKRARRNLSNYRKVNSLALNCLAPNGILITSCCSFHVKRNDYINVLKAAMKQSNRRGRIFHIGSQSPDHPIIPGVDGTDYLKCLFFAADN